MTPADLGKPIVAIVERCGTPDSVMSLATSNVVFYAGNGNSAAIWFDADQMRARILQFTAPAPAPPKPRVIRNVTLPFQSGPRDIALGQMTLADAQSSLAGDADVTTSNGAAFRSSPQNDIILAGSDDRVLSAAFVGERAAFVQLGFLTSPIDQAPLDYTAPVPRDAWLRPLTRATGARATLFRVDVDAAGIVRTVTVVIASGDPAFDASTQRRLADANFHAATIGKRPVAGTSFVQVRH